MNLKIPNLTTLSLEPENQETPIHFLNDWLTPNKYFFIRNHFDYPHLNSDMFKLQIEGHVNHSMIFSYEDIINMPAKEIVVIIECSGNKRKYFEPKVYGEQWMDGAISQGLWKGVSLNYLLTQAQVKENAKEVVFVGHDKGKRKDDNKLYCYERSLPIEKAMHPDTIIAYKLNNQDIPFKQGYPLRLIVPNWYGMASVKWLKTIRVIDKHFTGPFQDIDYNYYPFKDNDIGKKPVTTINISSIIQEPLNYSVILNKPQIIKGIAWTGMGNIESVDISTNGGLTWNKANLFQNNNQLYSWTLWEYQWNIEKEGEYEILSRAKDTFGRIQPQIPLWNRKGYGYNAIYSIKVKVV